MNFAFWKFNSHMANGSKMPGSIYCILFDQMQADVLDINPYPANVENMVSF